MRLNEIVANDLSNWIEARNHINSLATNVINDFSNWMSVIDTTKYIGPKATLSNPNPKVYNIATEIRFDAKVAINKFTNKLIDAIWQVVSSDKDAMEKQYEIVILVVKLKNIYFKTLTQKLEEYVLSDLESAPFKVPVTHRQSKVGKVYIGCKFEDYSIPINAKSKEEILPKFIVFINFRITLPA